MAQTGFRPKRDITEQVFALTSYIKDGFERGRKVGAVFADLSAAYNSVWREGLMTKVTSIVRSKKMLRLLYSMTNM